MANERSWHMAHGWMGQLATQLTLPATYQNITHILMPHKQRMQPMTCGMMSPAGCSAAAARTQQKLAISAMEYLPRPGPAR